MLALQEMDAPGAERLARALGYDYVYYPAAYHPTAGKDFGNAILVRGRIVADHKLLLPHPSRSRGLQRIAVAADVEVASRRLRVYSVHLETPAEIWPWQRREQVQAILSGFDPGALIGFFGGLLGGAAGLISDRVLELYPHREPSGSKFESGVVVVVGGSAGLTGAPTMAARSAQSACANAC